MTSYGPYNGILQSWYDGDTGHVDLDLGFGVFSIGKSPITGRPLLSCRLQGINPAGDAQPINAPELGTDAGKASLAYVMERCPPGTVVAVVSHGWDKYGNRFDGTIRLPEGTDLGAEIVAAGYAVWTTYGERRPG